MTTWRQYAGDLLYPALERVWALTLRAMRPLLARDNPARAWTPGGRVVVVAPHPDDETLGAGGVSALHVQNGDPVTIVLITDGRGSRAGGLSPAEMVRRRKAEVTAAAGALGVNDLVYLGLAEDDWSSQDARRALAPILEAAEVIYAPSCVDFHPDHLAVARIVAGLIQPGQTVRAVELGVPLTPVLANLVADIGPVAGRKAHALACFATQRGALAPIARLAHYRRPLYGPASAEVFWELPAAAYRRVIDRGDWTWATTPFRSIRPRPFSDPLAVLAGWQTRRQLRALARKA